jgi:glycosyltransferase involved in cell wall biosynthesis
MGLIESLSYGCPVVSFDINYGPSEIIIDGQNGFLVKSFDKEMFADRILQIISDDILQSKLSENSISLAQKYNSKSVSDLWHKLLIEKN